MDKRDKNISKIYSKTHGVNSEIIKDYDRLYSTLAERYDRQRSENTDLKQRVLELTTELNTVKITQTNVVKQTQGILFHSKSYIFI